MGRGKHEAAEFHLTRRADFDSRCRAAKPSRFIPCRRLAALPKQGGADGRVPGETYVGDEPVEPPLRLARRAVNCDQAAHLAAKRRRRPVINRSTNEWSRLVHGAADEARRKPLLQTSEGAARSKKVSGRRAPSGVTAGAKRRPPPAR